MLKHLLEAEDMVDIISQASDEGRFFTEDNQGWIAWTVHKAAIARYNRRKKDNYWPNLAKKQKIEVLYSYDWTHYAVRLQCDTPDINNVYVFVKPAETAEGTIHYCGMIPEEEALTLFQEMKTQCYWGEAEEPYYVPTEFCISEEI